LNEANLQVNFLYILSHFPLCPFSFLFRFVRTSLKLHENIVLVVMSLQHGIYAINREERFSK